ncbi:MAG: aggregation-promoting factor C-terminal-like domain-containing protein, partial [Streptosporangiaceae bacterium]
QAAASQAAYSPAASQPPAPSGSPQQIAIAMLPSFGWSTSQFSCLDPLWTRESGWNPYASNPTSGAYGIPQALPGSKMASAGADWQTNPATQIKWGLGYIQATYGSPCAAWAHETTYGWY